MTKSSLCFILAVASTISMASAAEAEQIALSTNGKATQTVVIAEKSSERVEQVAHTLADYLKLISGATFRVSVGDGTQGIAVGTSADFPKLRLSSRFDASDSKRREEYLLQSHAKGLQLIGATDQAVEHAVWDLLYRLGYRQYFPGKTWEVIPKHATVEISVSAFEQPDYYARRIWYGFGPWDYAKEPYNDWCVKNRCIAGFRLNTGHAYDRVVKAAQKEFDEHPEYWPLLNGERKPVRNPKPCLSNPAVRKIFVEHALNSLRTKPELDSISVDPSDGGGWCECEQCAKLGNVSDQAITLANEVATAIEAEFPGKLVGLYAYNYHSTPPNIRVHPNVVVSVATAFIKGGKSLDEIISGWADKGATLGIREYYSVNVWDRDQPGHARGGNPEYLQRTIPEFHSKGARFMSAESSDNWGPNGLGYYLAAHMLWDVEEAQNLEKLVDEFLTTAFGPASEPMRLFYRQLDASKPHLVTDDQIGRMFHALQQARQLAATPDVVTRIDQLTLYARYCSLFHQYTSASGNARQQAFEALIRHAYRMRTTMLVHTKALYRDLERRDKTVSIPKDALWNKAEEQNPWKTSEPFTTKELAAFIDDGIAKHPLVELDFVPTEYSDNLIPAAAKLSFPQDLPVGKLGRGRGKQTFYTYIEKAPAAIQLNITGGMIAHYRDRGNVKVDLWQIGGASETGERETLVTSDRSVPPDGKAYDVTLKIEQPGLYRLTINDGHDMTLVTWPDEQPMTVSSSQDEPMNANYRQWMAYFYVPKGTKVIGLFGGDHGEIRDSLGRPQFWLNGREANFYSVPVPPGEDGKLWHAKYVNRSLRLLTVPHYFSTTPQGLLLPKEVVEKDAK